MSRRTKTELTSTTMVSNLPLTQMQSILHYCRFQSDAENMSGCKGSQCFGKRDLKGFVAISEMKNYAVISEVKTKRLNPTENDMPCTGSQCLGRKRSIQQMMSQNEPQQQNSEIEENKEEGEMKEFQEKTKQGKEEKELKDYKKVEEKNIEEEVIWN